MQERCHYNHKNEVEQSTIAILFTQQNLYVVGQIWFKVNLDLT